MIRCALKYPGALFGVGSVTQTLFRNTILTDLQRICGAIGLPCKYVQLDSYILIGQTKFILFNLEQYSRIMGVNLSGVFLDELDELRPDMPPQVYLTARERARVNLPDRSPFIVITSTAQGKRGLYRLCVDLQGKKIPYMIIHGRTRDNTALSKTYYERLMQTYSTDAERKAFLEGEFVDLQGKTVFGGFSAEKSVLLTDFEVSPYATVMAGQDFNLGCSALVTMVVADGKIWIHRAKMLDDILDAPKTLREMYPDNDILWFPDASGKMIGSALKPLLSQYSISPRIGVINPPIEPRIMMLNALFRAGVIQISAHSGNAHLIEGLQLRGYDAMGMPEKGVGPQAYDHEQDALAYAVYRIVFSTEEFTRFRMYFHTDRAIALSESLR